MKNIAFSKIGLFALVVLMAAGSIGASVFFFQRYQKIQKLLQNPTEAAKEETRTLVAKVGTIIDLPKGEEPTVATITDVNQLQDQLFFIKAKNGDKVILYTNSGKVILYRPSENKIIDVAPINIGGGNAGPTPTLAPPPPASSLVKVALYNGSQTVGLTKIMENELKNSFPEIKIVTRENAGQPDYKKTLVIDLSGRQGELAQKIAGMLNGTVGDLPEGEAKPVFENEPIEMLVIAGNDYAAAKTTPTPTGITP